MVTSASTRVPRAGMPIVLALLLTTQMVDHEFDRRKSVRSSQCPTDAALAHTDDLALTIQARSLYSFPTHRAPAGAT